MKQVIISVALWLLKKVKSLDNNEVFEKAYKKGHSEGYSEGVKDGYDKGYHIGEIEGHKKASESMLSRSDELTEKQVDNLKNYLKKRKIRIVSLAPISYIKDE